MRINLTQGAQVFEYKGMVCHRYNAGLKISGDSVKVCFYQNGILSGFRKNRYDEEIDADGCEQKQREKADPEERWIKTGKMAKRRLYDFVACNLGKHTDHNGKRQTFKFFTCTFRDDVKRLDIANKKFKLFIGRLNYFFHKGDAPDFIKYVAVPELQLKNDRQVWHYHVLFFNLPYVPVSAAMVEKQIANGSLRADWDKRDTFFYLWGEGIVDICAVAFRDAYDVAGYIAKYIGKGLENDFGYAAAEGLLYKKRFLHSEGLIKPKIMIAFLNKEQRQQIFAYFKKHSKKFKRKGELGKYFETFSIENEFIGRMFGINFRSPKKHISVLEGLFNRYSYGFS